MGFLSFDIEIFNELNPENDLSKVIPSVAAIGTCEQDIEFFWDEPYMTKETAIRLVNRMWEESSYGGVPMGWNICSFDLQLLGLYSGEMEKCGEMALNGYDMMLWVTFRKGHFLGLDKALTGAGLSGKIHEVKFSDGSLVTDFSGAKAPEAWRNGEYEAVKEYLRGDILQPLELVKSIQQSKTIRWKSNTGRTNFCSVEIQPVKDLFKIPEPDTSWMTDPKPRFDFVKWIPENILEKYKIYDYL